MGELEGADGAIPVIDLFAGPGGLGEGFSSVEDADGRPVFEVGLSVEKDDFAVRTLQLRAFVRNFAEPPPEYYDFVRLRPEDQYEAMEGLFGAYPIEAHNAASSVLQATLGRTRWSTVFGAVDRALAGRPTDAPWVLVGGPPCQAYSLVGRARMKGHKESHERARLHRLYRHYLQILDRYRPPVFVMENVKGLLSAKVGGQPAFQRIVRHLEGPHPSGVAYEVVPFVVSKRASWNSQLELWNSGRDSGTRDHKAFLIESERFGIPQTRHRVIVLGIEQTLFDRLRTSLPGLVEYERQVGLAEVIGDLPRVRSGASKGPDSDETWFKTLGRFETTTWMNWLRSKGMEVVADRVVKAIRDAKKRPIVGRGGPCVAPRTDPRYRPDWFADPRLPGACNHESRAHIEGDLARYLFASAFAETFGRSPKLGDFPPSLRPAHDNVSRALSGGLFSDRFRVQLARDASGCSLPATTVTSHISKDGHYFIHYDPSQCRSLTVREAARVQTFPDNYVFLGPRTEQYKQVGNAVPPLLAHQMATVVAELLAPSRFRTRASGLLTTAQ